MRSYMHLWICNTNLVKHWNGCGTPCKIKNFSCRLHLNDCPQVFQVPTKLFRYGLSNQIKSDVEKECSHFKRTNGESTATSLSSCLHSDHMCLCVWQAVSVDTRPTYHLSVTAPGRLRSMGKTTRTHSEHEYILLARLRNHPQI